jgi:hypothetical protein
MPIVWILAALIVLFTVETVLTEVENWGWATVILIGTLGLAHLFHVFRVNEFVAAHGWNTAVYVFGYLVVGIVWSFIKWFSFLRNFRDKFHQLKSEFCKYAGLDVDQPIPPTQIKSFKDYIFSKTSYNAKLLEGMRELQRPHANDNKARITAWMAYWPCSLIGTFLNDPVRRLFNWLFGQFKASYQRLSDFVFRNDAELK